MNKIILLSQNNCPKCVVLDQYLHLGLNDRFKDQIEIVSREKDAKRFMQLARHNGIMATPALICKDGVLANPTPENTLEFLEQHSTC